MKPQTLYIYHALQNGQHLTHLIALRQFGCARLASRINEINTEIAPERVSVKMLMDKGKRFAEYSLPSKTPAPVQLPSGELAMF